MNDPINKPAHYTDGGDIEFLDALQCCLSTEEYIGFLRGQIMKYIWRCKRTGAAINDVRKAAFYNERLIVCLKAGIPESWLDDKAQTKLTSSPNRLTSSDHAD